MVKTLGGNIEDVILCIRRKLLQLILFFPFELFWVLMFLILYNFLMLLSIVKETRVFRFRKDISNTGRRWLGTDLLIAILVCIE